MRYTVPQVMPEVRALYARNPVGCCLHIVLDDGNVDDRSVDFCIQYALEHKHTECAELARKLIQMTKTQRMKLHKEH